MPSIQTSFDKIEKKLRNNPVFKNVPLIVLYDGDAHEAEIMSLEYGVNDFVPKPVDPVTVLLKVENLFRLTKISNKCESIETIINELPGGVIVMELSDGIHVRYMSARAYGMSMCNVNDYMKAYSDNIEERIIPEDRERVINFANSAGKNITDECTVDYRIMLPDGKIQWHEVLCKFIRKDGEKRIFYCVVTDVTEKKKINREIAWKNERYRLLAEKMNVVTFDYDPMCDTLTYDVYIEGSLQKPYQLIISLNTCLTVLLCTKMIYRDIYRPSDISHD